MPEGECHDGPPPARPKKPHKRKKPDCRKSYPEMLTAAMVVTIGLTEGRSNQELKTLLNFVNLLQNTINFVLAQRLIDEEAETQLDISLTNDI